VAAVYFLSLVLLYRSQELAALKRNMLHASNFSLLDDRLWMVASKKSYFLCFSFQKKCSTG
jgi:hypothetical protein